MRTAAETPGLTLSIGLALAILALALSPPPVHAVSSGSYTTFNVVVSVPQSSPFANKINNGTWTNTNDCGSFSGSGLFAEWDYGPGVGAIPCASSLPSGTITFTVVENGNLLATCAFDTGAATFDSGPASSYGSSPPPGCNSYGSDLMPIRFFATAYDASGNPIPAGSSGGSGGGSSGGSGGWWVTAVAAAGAALVADMVFLFLLVFRRRKRDPEAAPQERRVGPVQMKGNH